MRQGAKVQNMFRRITSWENGQIIRDFDKQYEEEKEKNNKSEEKKKQGPKSLGKWREQKDLWGEY